MLNLDIISGNIVEFSYMEFEANIFLVFTLPFMIQVKKTCESVAIVSGLTAKSLYAERVEGKHLMEMRTASNSCVDRLLSYSGGCSGQAGTISACDPRGRRFESPIRQLFFFTAVVTVN